MNMEYKRLGDLCNIVSGGTPSRSKEEYWKNGTIPWIKIGNIKGKFVNDVDEYITDAGLACSSAKMLSKDTILYTIFATLGEVGILEFDACTNQAIAGITIKNDKVIKRDYLFYYLKSKKKYVNDIGRGVAQNNINMSILRQFEVPLPTLEMQNKIIVTLEQAEKIIAFRRKQLQQLDELVKARFVELFGDPENNPKEWLKEALSNHLNVVGGYAFKSDSFLEEGIPVLRIGNINAGYFQPVNMVYWKYDTNLSRYMMYAGDLVMSLTGTVGKDDYGNVCILGNDYNCYYLNQRNAKLELFQTIDKLYSLVCR